MSNWQDGPLCAFDTETTGVDPQEARIVTAYLGLVEHGLPSDGRSWLADPGVEISEGATAIHGITTAFARQHGLPSSAIVNAVASGVCGYLATGIPVVVYNAAFDFTLLDRECRRNGLPGLEEMLGGPVRPVIDPLVLDKQMDRYRPGKRTLTATCAHYGVALGRAHDAEVDALAATGVACAIAKRYPEIATLSLEQLHALQVKASAEQAASFQSYLRRQGSETIIDGSWPLRPSGGERPA
ncbi:MAG: exonuclease domain-containing protein [Candidatus Dormibacteria bacterium]